MPSTDFVFHLQYVDSTTGQVVTKELPEIRIAQQLAKQLAKASGRRAVITRIRIAPTKPLLWTVRVADTQTREVYVLWDGLTKKEVLSRSRHWRERKTECVLVAWPQWLPQPIITLE